MSEAQKPRGSWKQILSVCSELSLLPCTLAYLSRSEQTQCQGNCVQAADSQCWSQPSDVGVFRAAVSGVWEGR